MFDGKLSCSESLSTDVFEPRTSTGTQNFSSSTRITPFSLKFQVINAEMRKGKNKLPVDIRASKTSVLKLSIVLKKTLFF